MRRQGQGGAARFDKTLADAGRAATRGRETLGPALTLMVVLILTLIVFAAAGPARAAEDDTPLAGVDPVALEGGLSCRVATTGLPADKTLRSIQGGLPSALSVVVELMDERDQPIQRRHYALRLAFDLWDEAFRLDGAGLERRFGTVDSLRGALRNLGPFPVSRLDDLAPGERYRLRVELLEYLIAPSQRARIGEMLAGDAAPASGAGPGDDMLLGFGRLIQFVYGRDRARDAPRHVAWSRWFTREVLVVGSP